MGDRTATVTRETAETIVKVVLALDGDGETTIDTGIGFFDHMLVSFANHGLFDLTVRCDGDLSIDDHHSIEDVAITLGQAFEEMTSDMARHFARSLVMNAGMTVHASVEGENAHHEIEALFKCLGRTLDDATRLDERRTEPPSTKEKL